MASYVLELFKLVTTSVFIVFGILISDVRNKKTKPLIKQPWISIMRITYPLSPICFLYFLWKLNRISIIDVLALAIMVLGTIIVFFAKRELGVNHSWTGYSTTNITNFIRTGIYEYVRHPLYLGIIIAVAGTGIFVLQRISTNYLVFCIYIVGMIFTIVFINISSTKETKYLEEKFGDEFIEYVEQVPALFPRLSKRNGFEADSKNL